MPARGGCDKKRRVLFHPAPPGATRLLEAQRPGRKDRGAKLAARRAGRRRVPIECRSAQRYVRASRGLVNKPPGQTHALTHVERGLVKLHHLRRT